MRKLLVPIAALVATAITAATTPTRACGMFVPSEKDREAAVPRLSTESVLVIFDEAKSREHFIREIRVDGGDREFGFVIPVPAKPEIAKVAAGLFKKLDDKLPFEPPAQDGAIGGKGSRAPGAIPASGGAPPVTVLETKKVGSFTATTLAATDGNALRDWLKTNGFAAPPTTEGWVNRYVKLGFVFVALKFDGKANAEAGTLVSETIRLSFDTPQAYYPYMEPAHADSRPLPRVLRAWTIATHAAKPVTSVSLRGGKVGFAFPWTEGLSHPSKELKGVLPPDVSKLLPKGDLVVQTWRDHHALRDGFGDIVFVPAEPTELDAAAKEKRKSLLPVLDPSLLEGEKPVTVAQ